MPTALHPPHQRPLLLDTSLPASAPHTQVFSEQDLTATRISAETMKIRWDPAELTPEARAEALARAVSFVKLLVRIDRETPKVDLPST